MSSNAFFHRPLFRQPREKIEEYVGEKIRGPYGHSEPRKRAPGCVCNNPNLQRRRLWRICQNRPVHARARFRASQSSCRGTRWGREKLSSPQPLQRKTQVCSAICCLFSNRNQHHREGGSARHWSSARYRWRGDADVLFVHANGERKFLAEGEGVKRFPVMHNDFVLITKERSGKYPRA